VQLQISSGNTIEVHVLLLVEGTEVGDILTNTNQVPLPEDYVGADHVLLKAPLQDAKDVQAGERDGFLPFECDYLHACGRHVAELRVNCSSRSL